MVSAKDIGTHITFVPLADATVTPDALQVKVSKARSRMRRTWNTDGELSADEEAELYRHFGMPYQPPPTQSGRRLARR
jgi:hypothetical protein